jgi:sugar lactone lactonase YvrE
MTDFTVLATGFVSVEAPRLHPDRSMYFSDLRAGGVHRLLPDGGTEVVVPERKMVGGICLHVDGGLVVSGPDLSHVREGEARVLLELSDIQARPGTRAVGFNDIEADRDGALFAGVLRQDGAGAYVCGELVKVTGAGRHAVVHDDLQPNGLGLSPDGSRLFAADTFHRRVLVFDVADGLATPAGEFSTRAVPGSPDGLAVDEAGYVWVAFYGGGCVARFTADGRLAERLDVPAIKPLSLCIGAEDGGRLYVVTGRSQPGAADAGAILTTHIDVGPAPVEMARI